MGLAAANEFATAPPPPEVAAAAAKGNSTSGSKGATAPEANDKAPPVEGMARPKLSFDYTHLGRKGADYFSAMMAEELANKVPEMRPLLIP